MDTFYIGDIPHDFHYAIFNANYVDLYNTPVLYDNTNYTYYRVYLNSDYFYYDIFNRNTYQQTQLVDVKVSNNVAYRKDFDSIVVLVFIFAIFGVWLFNLLTSCIRKGGLLGGLF